MCCVRALRYSRASLSLSLAFPLSHSPEFICACNAAAAAHNGRPRTGVELGERTEREALFAYGTTLYNVERLFRSCIGCREFPRASPIRNSLLSTGKSSKSLGWFPRVRLRATNSVITVESRDSSYRRARRRPDEKKRRVNPSEAPGERRDQRGFGRPAK